MSRLSIRDITFAALHGGIHKAQLTSTHRLGQNEISALAKIIFEDVHRNSHELNEYASVYEFVYAKMKRFGYLASTENHALRLECIVYYGRRVSEEKDLTKKEVNAFFDGIRSNHLSRDDIDDSSSEDDEDNEDYCRVLK